MRVIFLLLLVPVCLSPSAPAELLNPPDVQPYLDRKDIAKQLEKGDMVVVKQAHFADVFNGDIFNEGKGTLVLFLVPQSVETAWNELNDFDEHHTYMPHMSASEHLRTENGREIVRYDYDVLWTESTAYLAGECDRASGTLVWRVAPEHSDKRLAGLNVFWRVLPYDRTRTVMVYFHNIKYSSSIGSMGSKFFVSAKDTAKAVRKKVWSFGIDDDGIRPQGND